MALKNQMLLNNFQLQFSTKRDMPVHVPFIFKQQPKKNCFHIQNKEVF